MPSSTYTRLQDYELDGMEPMPGSPQVYHPMKDLAGQAVAMQNKSMAPGPMIDLGGSKWQSLHLLWSPTFLGDADGSTAHAHTQPVHTSVNQVLGLGCCHHWGWGR